MDALSNFMPKGKQNTKTVLVKFRQRFNVAKFTYADKTNIRLMAKNRKKSELIVLRFLKVQLILFVAHAERLH